MIRLGPGHYFGHSLGTRRFGSLTLTTTRYRAGDVLPRHCHEQPYLFVTLAGAAKERALGKDHVCTRGWLIFNEAGEAHHDQVLDCGAEGVNVEFERGWLERFGEVRAGKEMVLYRHAGAALAAVGALQSAILSRDALRTVMAEEAVTTLMGALQVEDVACRAWVAGVASHVRDARGQITGLAGLSREAGVHPAHLCREFRRAHGCTVTEYAARVRADAALERVLRTKLPLASIGVECGYSDQSHMTRAFRRYFSTTPGRLRLERASR